MTDSGIESSGRDESKYQKRRRKTRQGTKRMSWTLFCSLFAGALLILAGSIVNDYFHQEKKRNRMGALKRAKQIMEERRRAGLGGGGGGGDGRGGSGGSDRNNPGLRSQINGLFQEAKDITNQITRGEHNHDYEHEHEHEHNDGRHEEKPGLMTRMFGAKKPDKAMEALREQFQQLDHDIQGNIHGGIRWIQDNLLRDLPGKRKGDSLLERPAPRRGKTAFHEGGIDFTVKRKNDPPMTWETEWDQMTYSEQNKGPKVDYTKHNYEYPNVTDSPPERYPHLEPMEELMKRWPQDSLDDPPSPFVEKLMHFNYSDPQQRAMAVKYRDAELPFKVFDVPEVVAAGGKWTDKYVANNFDDASSIYKIRRVPRSKGNCQESHDNFFAFFTPMGWQFGTMGPPPYRNNDWSFEKWANHAKYADSVGLSFDQPHFYWQSGVPKTERFDPESDWTFVSRDLPSFSSTEETFFQFHPDEQKGIQCRFGERGVTAATHYDAGRNMVAMIKGAKRYILSPPKECSKLGIVTVRGNTLFRHSLLNFGHISHLDTDTGNEMPEKERSWLERSKTALAVETVLKAGEVLFIPSHWFHYINSVQKSAQCNVRSGVDEVGTRAFGGAQEVYECVD